MTDIPDDFGPSIDWTPLDAALEGHGPNTDPSYWQCRSHKRQEQCCMDDHWHAIFDLRARIKGLEAERASLIGYLSGSCDDFSCGGGEHCAVVRNALRDALLNEGSE